MFVVGFVPHDVLPILEEGHASASSDDGHRSRLTPNHWVSPAARPITLHGTGFAHMRTL
jgi:hypothetical protein